MLRLIRTKPNSAAVALALAGSLLAACMSASEGDALRRRVRELEQGQLEQQETLQTEIETARTKVVQLEEVLDRATKVVTRASADTGAQVEQLQEQVMALEGQLAELRNEVQRQQMQIGEQQQETDRQLKRIAQRVGIDQALDDSEIPPGADEHFAAAEQAFQSEEYSRARALYRAFVDRHGEDERIDDAQFRIGASYLEEGRPATALGALREVVADHPRGNVADDALFAMARAFYELHACTDARSALEAFVRTHRSSDVMPQARELLRTVQRAPRSYCTR